ncbi:uncharacterized protein LOC141590127 [Silene latifolia]|uniref:uncharacterized protein LOC141590127 n=1 Tax=Silene latifolia TaxID=37657 RepID=UPI003D77EBCE
MDDVSSTDKGADSKVKNVTARIKAVTRDPTGLNSSEASQEFFEGEKIQKYVAEAEQIAERLKVSVGNAPAFGEVVNNQPSDKEIEKSTVPSLPMDTQELMECMFSTAEIKEALCGLPADGSGPGGEATVLKDVIENVEQQPNNGGENVVVVDGVEVTPGDPSTEWSGNQIPLNFMSTADVNEAFAGVDEGTISAAKEGVVVEIAGSRVEPVAPPSPPFM